MGRVRAVHSFRLVTIHGIPQIVNVRKKGKRHTLPYYESLVKGYYKSIIELVAIEALPAVVRQRHRIFERRPP